mmetsp:Transcript_15861/g.25790  ORF Transcript_15861/g.25790 Transcript_15861/m.25790 type:complete len:165 (+) Transcript_15861:95-589(+)
MANTAKPAEDSMFDFEELEKKEGAAEEPSGMTHTRTAVFRPEEKADSRGNSSEVSMTRMRTAVVPQGEKEAEDAPKFAATRTAVFVPSKEESKAKKMTRMRTAQMSGAVGSPESKNPKAMLEQDYMDNDDDDEQVGRAELVRNIVLGGIVVAAVAFVVVKLTKR